MFQEIVHLVYPGCGQSRMGLLDGFGEVSSSLCTHKMGFSTASDSKNLVVMKPFGPDVSNLFVKESSTELLFKMRGISDAGTYSW